MKDSGNESQVPERPLLILDLDETLIHATEIRHSQGPDFIVGQYGVLVRPGLEAFLKGRSVLYDLAIWSSGTAEYVNAIVCIIMPDSVQAVFVWSRERCGMRRDLETDQMYYQKDLKKVLKLGYKLSRIVIVEDNKQNVRRNFGNAVYISPFEGDPADRELDALGPFLDHLSKSENFREVEKRNWKLFKPSALG